MKGLQFIWLFCLLSLVADGQGKYDANWCFGIKAGIDFSDTANPVNFKTLCNNYDAAPSISDSLGQLLYYFAPDTPFTSTSYQSGFYSIFNSNNTILPNGNRIFLADRLDDALFLKVPNSSNEFYLFYMFAVDTSFLDSNFNVVAYSYKRLCYARIRHGANSDTVLERQHIASNSPLEWRLSAVKHANGTDWWLMTHKSNRGINNTYNNTYLRFLITQDSISGPFQQDIGYQHQFSIYGVSVFSGSGHRLASALDRDKHGELFDFDRCTGLLSNYIDIAVGSLGDAPECEFSKNENKLYFAETDPGQGASYKNTIYQYSLDSPFVAQTRRIIWADSIFNNTTYRFGLLKRAPNDKIYLTTFANGAPYSKYLWAINTPDSFGTACNFQPLAYYIGDSATTMFSLPNMPNYNLGALSIYQSDAGRDTFICSGNTQGIMIGTPTVAGVRYNWQGGNINNPALAQPTVRPTQSGWYYLTATDTSIRYSCQSRTDSVYIQVRTCCDSTMLLQATAGRDTSFCGDNPTIISVPIGGPPVAGVTYTWQAGQGISNIHNPSQSVHPTNSTWYYVTFGDSTNPSCPTRIDSVHVVVLSCCDSALLLQATAGRDTSFCGDNPTLTSVPIGGAPVAGVTYTWQAGQGISNVHNSSQLVRPSNSTWYYVTFGDSANPTCPTRIDSVHVVVLSCCDSTLLMQATAGKDTSFCKSDSSVHSVTIGGAAVIGVIYTWQAATSIINVHSPTQSVYPDSSTWYYVTFSDSGSIDCSTRRDSVYVEVRTFDTTGINETAANSQRLTIYPNPAQNTATLQWHAINSGEVTITVCNLLGAAMQQITADGTTATTQLDIANLPNGWYVIKLSAPDGGVVSGKLGILH